MLSGSRNNLAYIGFTKYKPCNFSIGWPSRCSKSEVCSLAYWTSEQKRRRDQATRHHLPKRVDGNDFAKIQSSFCSKFILKVWNTYRLKVKGEKKDRQENLNIYLLNSQKKNSNEIVLCPRRGEGPKVWTKTASPAFGQISWIMESTRTKVNNNKGSCLQSWKHHRYHQQPHILFIIALMLMLFRDSTSTAQSMIATAKIYKLVVVVPRSIAYIWTGGNVQMLRCELLPSFSSCFLFVFLVRCLDKISHLNFGKNASCRLVTWTSSGARTVDSIRRRSSMCFYWSSCFYKGAESRIRWRVIIS